MRAFEFKAEIKNIESGIEFIKKNLVELKVHKKQLARSLFSIEEIFSKLIEHAEDPESIIQIRIRHFLSTTTVHMSCKGSAIRKDELQNQFSYMDGNSEAEAVVRNMMSSILLRHVSLTNKNGVNGVDYVVHRSKNTQVIHTLVALALGILTGALLKLFIPVPVTEWISSNIFYPITTMFMSALKLIVLPLVFFSIASSIADFDDLKALGKIALRILSLYICTSVLAIGIGYIAYQIFPIGDPILADAVTDIGAGAIVKSSNVSVSILDTIVNIVPSNFAKAFLNGNILQVIFLAILVGAGTPKISGKNEGFRVILTNISAAINSATSIIISFMPAAIFCSMAKMVTDMDPTHLLKAVTWIPACYLGQFLMLCTYMLLLLILARLNPLKFLRGFAPAMLTAYSFGSSSATLPTSIKMCDRRLGISKKLYSFSIPLGATINMDGSCVTMMISILFMAKIFGIEVSSGMLMGLFFSILALSIGAPGVPGACLICITMLLGQVGIPLEAIGLIMGLYSLVGMGLTCINVTGDAIVTTIVAKNCDMIDLKKFNAN